MNPCPDSNTCYGCGACVVACPRASIRLVTDEEGFDYPVVDESACTQCGTCRSVCGAGVKGSMAKTAQAAYAAWHTSAVVRAQGTSGSAFTALAETVLRKGGVVVGAAFAEDFRSVSHLVVDTSEKLEALRGSKYVQSSTVDAFRQVVGLLRSGKEVCFTGTPCQVQALRRLAGDQATGLTTCDIVCHGVPSPAVFGASVCEAEQKKRSKTVRYRFRDKRMGWNISRVTVDFENGAQTSRAPWADRFLNGYYANYLLRPCCYVCPFARPERVGDLTLGDCWRVAASHPRYDDNKGTSLILVGTARGESLLVDAEACGQLFRGAYDLDLACQRNTPLRCPAVAPAGRGRFFETFKTTCRFHEASRVYFRPLFAARKQLEQWVKYLIWPLYRRFQ